MRPDEGPTIVLTEEHRAKICMDMICKFLHQWPDDTMGKPNMCVKDYSLEQFQWRIGKQIYFNHHPRDKKLEKKLRERKKE